jgi:peptidoglycan/xylan/chitin deacetylase (PgdA/CDA1 family)
MGSDHISRPPTIRKGLLGVGTLALAAHAAPALAQPWAPLRRALGIEDRLTTPGHVALTFDDGPHPQGTPATLELLADAGVEATFFLVGEQVRRYGAIVGEILAAGHQVALHCDRHRNLLRLTPHQTRADLDRAAEVIAAAGAPDVRFYRPPYGVFNATALREARGRGWRPLLWTRWGRDWQARALPQTIAERLTDGVAEGDVLLLHDADWYSAPESWMRMVGALPAVLEAIDAAGLRFGRLN